MRRAWFEARRPAVGELVSGAVRGSHLTMRVEGVLDEPMAKNEEPSVRGSTPSIESEPTDVVCTNCPAARFHALGSAPVGGQLTMRGLG